MSLVAAPWGVSLPTRTSHRRRTALAAQAVPPAPPFMPEAPEAFDDGRDIAPFPFPVGRPSAALGETPPESATMTPAWTSDNSCMTNHGVSVAELVEKLNREVAQLREELASEVESGVQRAAGPLAAALAPLLSNHFPKQVSISREHTGPQQGAQHSIPATPEERALHPAVSGRLTPSVGMGTPSRARPVRLDGSCRRENDTPPSDTAMGETSFHLPGGFKERSPAKTDFSDKSNVEPSRDVSRAETSRRPSLSTPSGVPRPRRFYAVGSHDAPLDMKVSAVSGLPDDQQLRRLSARRRLLTKESRRAFRALNKPNWWVDWLDLEEEPPRTSALALCLASRCYQKFVALVIFLNIVFVGYSADYAVSHPNHRTSHHIIALELAFIGYFALEVSAKMFIHRLYFFVGNKWQWHWLELVIICISGAHVVFDILDMETDFIRADQFRLLRMLQATTILRAFRGVQVCPELQVLLRTIEYSTRSLGWSLIMLLMIFYIFSIFFVGVASEAVTDRNLDKMTENLILDRFGSTWKALTSLFTASLGGIDWEFFADILKRAGMLYYIVFLCFIAFVVLAALNILTGVFVERAVFVDQNDFRGITEMEEKRERSLMKEFTRIFYAILLRSGKGDNTSMSTSTLQTCRIAQEDFQGYVENVPGVRHLFSVLGLKIWDPTFFINLVMRNCPDGQVDVETFVDVCMRLRGPATCFDLQCLLEFLEAQSQGERSYMLHAFTGSRG